MEVVEVAADLLRSTAAPLQLALQVFHALYIARKLRQADPGLAYARRTPLASLVAFLAVNFGAAIVLAALFGDKLAFVTDPVQLGIAVAVWYLVFFSPFDIVYIATDIKPVKIVLGAIEGVRNSRRMVYYAAGEGSDEWLSRILRGWLAGAGSLYVAQLVRFFQGAAGTNELAAASAPNRVMLTSAIVFVATPLLEAQTWRLSAWPAALRPVEAAVLANLDVILIVLNGVFLAAAAALPDLDPVGQLLRPVWALVFGSARHASHPPPGGVSDRAAETAAVARTGTARSPAGLRKR